jgi:osmotically-inducible protein OsmY
VNRIVSILLGSALFALPLAGRAQTGSVPAQDAGTALAATVEQAWIADKSLPSYLMAAAVREGKLELFGAVNNSKQHAKAVAIAKKAAGATPVEDHIAVVKTAAQSGTPVGAAKGAAAAVPAQDEAAALAATVEQAWIQDGTVPYYLVAAKVRNGQLELFGAVETAAQRDQALALAKQAAGTTPVVDHIAIAKIASQSPTPKK